VRIRATSSGGLPSGALVCPGCGSAHGPEERFCPSCRLPLVHDSTVVPPPDTDRRRRQRKVKPQLGEGELVRVAGARNLAEAEFIQGLLLEEGVPSLLRRSAGFDVPDFLAAGPRDVLVPQSGVAAAREVLLQAEIIAEPSSDTGAMSPLRLAAGLLVALGVAILIVWIVFGVLESP
jgi:hypothetical protein